MLLVKNERCACVRVGLALALMLATQSAVARGLEIRSLSSRADLVSGGDVLIEITPPRGTQSTDLELKLNGKDVSSQMKADAVTGHFVGLVTGLAVGPNTLSAKLKSRARVSGELTLTNHPITGPILSGPHLTPYECRTVESGLGEPLDANCSVMTKADYFYRTKDGAFKPWPKVQAFSTLPDMATTTTIDGKTVPYVVRVESGTINRSIYRIAVLDEPPPITGLLRTIWQPGDAWNRRLAVSFGGGNGTQYNQGTNQVTSALNDLYLSRGFAFMVSTELVNQLHSNAVLQGETLMMLKEYVIERFGVPKWTVGVGGSGGAIQQLLITQTYPGLLDGLQPSLSFPDSALHTSDCGVLQNYWKKADPAVWTDAKKAAVDGFTKGTCAAWERSFVPALTATNARGCALKDGSKVYDPVNNPKGARCTVQDMRANIYGRDPATGFARKTQDNIGLQYGLAGLNSSAISVDEFLDLNEKIGGNDIDGNFTTTRTVGDPIALRALYESGLINAGSGGLGTVPILHTRPYTDAIGDIHDRHRDFTIRARLQRENGNANNQVIWVGPPRPIRGEDAPAAPAPGANLSALSLDTMTQWLDAMAADSSKLSPRKVVKHKPKAAIDACFTETGEKIPEAMTFESKGKCNTLYPVHSEPRMIAGAPLVNDITKCQLKPINFRDYKVTFSDAQKQRLQAIFPSGVCDFKKPGVEQRPLKGTYQRY